MQTKTIEIRDRMTFIAALAIRLGSDGSEADRFLLSQSGFGRTHEFQQEYIILVRLNSTQWTWDPLEWGDRTMATAHDFIVKNWDSLESGAVVDVEHILGETTEPKVSERMQ